MPISTKGLDYFPISTDFFEDDRITILTNDFGLEAASVVLKLYCRIYKNGFYTNWNGKICKIFTGSFRSKYDSKEIQKRFFTATYKRKCEEVSHPEYLLITIETKTKKTKLLEKKSSTDDENRQTDIQNPKNDDSFQQSKVKESKVKESKGKESKGNISSSSSSSCACEKNSFESYHEELAKDEEWRFSLVQASGKYSF